jgi:ubiquinone/menaquinone biosynthesis C-methylase UbiE/uncharacterized protein YbaR (Trm112 family)
MKKMDQKFINSLICPACKNKLSLQRNKAKQENVSDNLHCKKCDSVYPVINGIPRILTKEDQKTLVKCGQGYAQIATQNTTNKKATDSRKNERHDYNYKRLNSAPVKFSLKCRALAISRAIMELYPHGLKNILDLGSADGLLARQIAEVIPNINFSALDLDDNLLEHNPFSSVQGNCCRMPFADNTFDAVTAAALIEHLPDPQIFLKECYRVLKPGGALFLTCPAPFFDWLATKIGYLKDAGHLARYGISDLQKLCESVSFKNIYARKFMISPLYFPGHLLFESFLRRIGLSFLMLNQVLGSIRKNKYLEDEK